MEKRKRGLEVLLWSIALPGFGQLLNQKYIKGFIFLVLEFLINVKANFNVAILASFNGDIQLAFELIDVQWLMFYPGFYFFSIWDAYRDARGEDTSPFLFLPFVFAAKFVTVGLMISERITLFGVMLGPVFFPMLAVLPGLAVGFLLKMILTHYDKTKRSG
ncbi:hypothetical protein [Bacillus sp. B15-48]|uniref:hypothetical protein n=1 Tax=Bacillus sp. B15-48 TaxID=1548601 RepID=UPI00193EF942|nr:hypothetical protein [Bacillus sp. B15-48]MBM4761488.1 hypothetical protein [Bacillus sp. B15-48]